MNEDTMFHDEKSSGLGKLESLSQEELIKLIKNQFSLKKKLELKISDLTSSNTSLNQTEKELRQEIEQNQLNQSKIHEELDNLRNELSLVRSSLINESQKASSRSELLSHSITAMIDLFQLPLSLPDSIDNDFIEIYQNELEQKHENLKQIFEQFEQEKNHFQQRIEDLEFFNEEMKLENDDLRSKSSHYQKDKQTMEKEIDNYRRQVEDFEEQFLELQRESDHHHHYETSDKSQQQPSITSSLLTLHQLDDNVDEITIQCLTSILDQIDDIDQQISKASSTSSLLLSSDIPTLLHSVGITNCTDEQFSIPLNFESVLRLSTLLIERCRVLQYILLKNNDISLNSSIEHDYTHNCLSFSQTDQYQQCKISIHRQDHLALDTLFERIYLAMNEKMTSNQWEILIERPIDQKISPSIRLQFDQFKFISDDIEHDLIRLRSQYDQLSKENEQQRREISTLEKRLHSNKSYEQLKSHQTHLEQQLAQQIEKTIQLESILQQANIDKIKLDQFNRIEFSYHELQEKYHIAEKLEEQLKELNEHFHQKSLAFDKLQLDYEYQHVHLLERDETIRLLKFQLNERTQSEQILVEQYQHHMKTIQTELEQQKSYLSNASDVQDQHFSSILKQQDHMTEQMQSKIIDNQSLFEENIQLKKQLDEYQQMKDEQTTSSNSESIEENVKLHQTINQLNEKIERQNSENTPELKEKYHKMKILLTRLKKELQDKNQQPKQSLIDLELADYEKTIQTHQDELIHRDKDLQELRDELTNSITKYTCLQFEIKNLEQQKLQNEERANKFKVLLDAAKKELQHAKDIELQRYQNDDHVRSLIETLQNQLESKTILIKELTNEKQLLTEKLNYSNETSQKTNNLLEQNFRIAKHDLDIAKQDYDTLQDDFNSYKVRAQSVLKQQQLTQRERTPSLADKNLELEEKIDKFQSTLEEVNNKIQLLMSENEALQKEQDRLIEIQAKLINESRKRDQDLRKQHQIELSKMESECLQQINDTHDMLKTVTLQNETLSIAYKEQIATIENEHEQAIAILQDQLRTSEQEIEIFQTRLESFEQNPAELTSISDSTQIGIKNDLNRDKNHAWNVSARQQGEHSDSTNNTYLSLDIPVQTTLENVPVETLNAIENIPTTNDDNTSLSSNDKLRLISSSNNEFEQRQIDEEFKQIKLRLIDTTELFNESELNNKRLTEQVTLLKDEIRRIERNMARAESISNLEYLKNIILKFFILKSTPERLQLIPVLVTMLKLSPDEQAQLVRVANISTINEENSKSDESQSQPITNGSTPSSWGSYLNIW